MKYYLVIRKAKMQPFSAKWRELERIMYSKASWDYKNKQ